MTLKLTVTSTLGKKYKHDPGTKFAMTVSDNAVLKLLTSSRLTGTGGGTAKVTA